MHASTSVSAHERYVLAVDLGTGGPKVGIASCAGEIVDAEHLPVASSFGPDGEATQDADHWWKIVLESARRLLGTGAITPGQVDAISCTGQWASTVPVDGAGRPVGPCLLWRDTRGGGPVRARIGGPVAGYAPVTAARFIRRSGGAPSTSGADPIGHILFLESNEPDVARRTRWYLEPVDYLTMRFSGQVSASPASMAASWLTDNRRPSPTDYDPVLVAAAGLPPAKLPPLVPSGSVVANVAPSVADELGLREDVAVIAGTPDLHSGCVGSGAVLDRQAHIAVSTTSWVSCPFPRKKTDPFRQIATVPGIVPGLNLVADNQESGGAALEWLGRLLEEQCTTGLPSTDPRAPDYEDLTSLAARAPAGSGGLIFTPWLAGERSPVDDRSARGGFHNLSLQTSRAELVRSVLEGVALNFALAHVRRRAVRRPAVRRRSPHRWRRPIAVVVLHLCQRARPSYSTDGATAAGKPPWGNPDRRARPQGLRTRRHLVVGADRADLRTRSGATRRL